MDHAIRYRAVTVTADDTEIPALQAWCSCGWAGRRCPMGADAESDARSHALWHDGTISSDGAI